MQRALVVVKKDVHQSECCSSEVLVERWTVKCVGHTSRYERCSIAMLDVAQQLGNIPHCSSLLYSFDLDFSMLPSTGRRSIDTFLLFSI